MYKRARLGMGYLPQEESIFRKMTVEQNILAILETLPLSKAERKNRCDQLLHQFGIERIAKNQALTLSGGEKRRLTIARSLVTKPKLLMLDEPFSGVDPIAVYDVQQIIVNLRKSGLAIMITDHNVRETLSIVDRAYLIFEGPGRERRDERFPDQRPDQPPALSGRAVQDVAPAGVRGPKHNVSRSCPITRTSLWQSGNDTLVPAVPGWERRAGWKSARIRVTS